MRFTGGDAPLVIPAWQARRISTSVLPLASSPVLRFQPHQLRQPAAAPIGEATILVSQRAKEDAAHLTLPPALHRPLAPGGLRPTGGAGPAGAAGGPERCSIGYEAKSQCPIGCVTAASVPSQVQATVVLLPFQARLHCCLPCFARAKVFHGDVMIVHPRFTPYYSSGCGGVHEDPVPCLCI